MKLLRRIVATVGVALLLPLLYLFVTSGLVAPGLAVIGFLALWAVLVILAIRWFRTRPFLVLGLPFAGLLVWYAVLLLGDALLGWTA